MLRSLPLFLLCLCVVSGAFSQRVDPTFQPKLVNYSFVYNTTPLPDGKAIVMGDFEYINGTRVGGIARMNTDGTIDAAFKTGAGAEDGGSIQSVVRYNDGKLLVCGEFSTFNGKDVVGIVRLNADGTFDNSFTSPFTGTVYVFGAAIQSTGKIVITGVTVGQGNLLTYFIARLNADGTKDNSFQGKNFPGDDRVSIVKVVANDKILAGGWFSAYGGAATQNNLVRLNADGTLDNTFNANLADNLNTTVSNINVLADGKMFISRNIKLTKLNSDGSPDNSFAPAADISASGNIVILDDGSLVVASGSKLLKYNTTGSLLTQVDAVAQTVNDLGNGRLLLGNIQGAEPFVNYKVRNASLAVDNGWAPALMISTSTEFNISDGYRVRKQGDKWLVRAYANFFTSGSVTALHPINGIFRLNSDFTFDNTFNFTATEYRDAKMLYVDATGRIYVQQTLSSNVRGISRLNANGTLDNTFAQVPVYTINDMDEIGDGNFIAVEWDYSVNKGKLKKFSSTGVVDNSLNVVSIGQMQTIDVASDGKWYVMINLWDFSAPLTVNGTSVKRIFRMNPDGTLDAGFNFQSVVSDIFTMDTQGDKIMAAGNIIKKQGDNFSVSVERWTTTGATDIQQDDAIRDAMGMDFMIKGDYMYIVALDGDEFEVRRAKLTGEVDKLFAPVHYRTGALSIYNPDRIYSYSDNSILVIGDGTYKIDIVAPTNAPTVLEASVSTTTNVAVTLNWSDNSEDEGVFELERAEGNGAFTLLATLDADIITYKDNTAADGKSYKYRIRAVNVAGATEYSNVAETGLITGIGETVVDFSFYPNPVKDFVHVQSNTVVHTFSLRQVDGRLIESADPGSNEFKINMTNYASGLYLLQLDGTNNRKTIKIFKQ